MNLEGEDFSGAEEQVLAPEGEHPAQIIGSEVKDTRSGDGKVVRIDYCLLNQPHGRQDVSEWIVIRHKNKTAEQLGRAKFAKLCKALGISNPKDTIELHKRQLIVRVEHAEFNDNLVCRVTGHKPAPKVESPVKPSAAAPSGEIPF